MKDPDDMTCEEMVAAKDAMTSAFKAELLALLAKYDAELSAEDHYTGYPECGEDVRMTVEFCSPIGYATLDLGRWVKP